MARSDRYSLNAVRALALTLRAAGHVCRYVVFHTNPTFTVVTGAALQPARLELAGSSETVEREAAA